MQLYSIPINDDNVKYSLILLPCVIILQSKHLLSDDSEFRKPLFKSCKNASLCSPVSFSLWIIDTLHDDMVMK